ncbi:hypothetical protein EIK56_27185 [Sphingomonas sp. C8-2]|nr:hypothetical protein EIK56_27185 [Sphingomonas sp. C8-2]
MTKYFDTLDGIKRAAKKLGRDLSIPHHDALDRVAREVGYQNFVHATRTFPDHGQLKAAPPRFAIEIHQFWADRKAGERGTEKLAMTLGQSLDDLVKAHQCEGFLGGTEVHDGRLLIGHGRADDRDHARMWVCRLARTLQFMEATGLKPSASRRGFPKSQWSNRLPGADHDHHWYHPGTRSFYLTDEPYPGAGAKMYAAERAAWCDTHGYDVIASPWRSIYGLGTELYLVAKRGGPLTAGALALQLEKAPPPINEIDWQHHAVTR